MAAIRFRRWVAAAYFVGTDQFLVLFRFTDGRKIQIGFVIDVQPESALPRPMPGFAK